MNIRYYLQDRRNQDGEAAKYADQKCSHSLLPVVKLTQLIKFEMQFQNFLLKDFVSLDLDVSIY